MKELESVSGVTDEWGIGVKALVLFGGCWFRPRCDGEMKAKSKKYIVKQNVTDEKKCEIEFYSLSACPKACIWMAVCMAVCTAIYMDGCA